MKSNKKKAALVAALFGSCAIVFAIGIAVNHGSGSGLVDSQTSGLVATSNMSSTNDINDEVSTAQATAVDEAVVTEATDKAPSIVAADEGEAYASGRILVSFAPGATDADISRVAAELGSSSNTVIDDDSTTGALVAIDLPEGTLVASASLSLESDETVVGDQPDYVYTLLDDSSTESATEDDTAVTTEAAAITNDASISKQWALDSIDIKDAWAISKSSGSVSVAVLDTGCNMSHPDLVANLDSAHAYDVQSKTHTVTDDNGHGTHVAGIIAATSDNGIGVSGASYNAKIVPVDVMSSTGQIYTSSLTAAYKYVISISSECNIRVINMSLGGFSNYSDTALTTQIDAAYSKGILTVCAAGNKDSSTDPTNIHTVTDSVFPSDYPTCVSVVNLKSDNTLSTSSCRGDAKDIAAPGSSIYSTSSTGGYVYMSGTSMASPLVAGVSALLFAKDPSLTCDEAKEALYSTATDLGDSGFDSTFGWGKVNPTAALKSISKDSSATTSPNNNSSQTETNTSTRTKSISTTRLAGSGRLDTMAKIVNAGFTDSSDTVILANGWGFADALSASSLAGVLECPVVTTETSTLSDQALQQIERLGASNVIILGGTGAVSANTESMVSGIAGVQSVTRISGASRYETNLDVYEAGLGKWSNTCIITNGANYADALSIAPYAFASNSPIFLTQNGLLTDEAAQAIQDGGFTQAIILGGSGAVSNSVTSQLGSQVTSIRLSGSSRLETSEVILNWTTGNMTDVAFQPGKTLSCSNMAVTTAWNYPDALVSADLLGNTKNAVLLVDDSNASQTSVDRVISEHEDDINQVVILGGTSSVSSAVEQNIAN